VAGVNQKDETARAHMLLKIFLEVFHRERRLRHVVNVRVVRDEVEVLRREGIGRAVSGDED